MIVEIWPVPEGHKSAFNAEKVRPSHRVDLSDLIIAGCLHIGMTLTPRCKKFMSMTATLLGDGRVDIEGVVYSSASEAAKTLTGAAVSGWWFCLVDKQAKKSLRDVRIEYWSQSRPSLTSMMTRRMVLLGVDPVAEGPMFEILLIHFASVQKTSVGLFTNEHLRAADPQCCVSAIVFMPTNDAVQVLTSRLGKRESCLGLIWIGEKLG